MQIHAPHALVCILLSVTFNSLSNAQDAKPNTDATARTDSASTSDSATTSDSEEGWKPLLPKTGLEGWEITNFGGEGAVENREGTLVLDHGNPMTGITRLGKDFPTQNYELRWSAQRSNGTDFFVGVTFPVGKEFCSFISGGWGGGLVGISSINGNDASENETASYRNFKNGTWYAFRVRVDATHITVWLDDEQILHVARENRRFSVRAEVMRSRPLGYCVYQSKVLVKDWEYRTIE